MSKRFKLGKQTLRLAEIEKAAVTLDQLMRSGKFSTALIPILPAEQIGGQAFNSGDVVYLRNGFVTTSRFAVGDRSGCMIDESLTLNVGPAQPVLRHIQRHDGEPTTQLPGLWVVLSNWSTNVYFHWFAQGLPNLCILRHVDLPRQARFITSRLSSWQRAALRLAGIDPSLVLEVEEGVYQCEHLLYPTDLQNQPGVISPRMLQVCDDIRARVLRTVRSDAAFRKIYVARFDSASRILDNEGALVDRLRRLGYSIVTTSFMEFEQEVLAFAGARLIVGAAGSGMTNLAFAQPGTAVLELNCLGDNYHLFEDLARKRQLEWHSILFQCPRIEQNAELHWEIDDLDSVLRSLAGIEATEHAREISEPLRS